MTPEQQKEFFKKTFTLQGRMFHPHVLVPSARKPGDAPKFSVMFAWPKNSNAAIMQEMNAFIQQAMQACHPGIPAQVLIYPVKDFNTYMREDGKPNPDYVRDHFWVNASSGAAFPPAVVNYPDRQPVLSEAEVYSGTNAVCNISFYNMSGATGGKRGIGINFNAAMILEGGDKLAGGGAVDVNQAFGNFQVDMGLVNAVNMQQPVGGAPVQQPMQQPVQQPAQPVYTPPVQQPMQQPVYAPPAQQPMQPETLTVPQPMQQPVQQPMQQPAQPATDSPFAPQPQTPNTYV